MVSKISFLKTDAALAEAGAFADEFPHTESRGGGSSVSTVYSGSTSDGSSKSEKSEKKDYSWIGIPAFLISLGTIYFIGQKYAEWSQAKAAAERAQPKTTTERIQLLLEDPEKHPLFQALLKSLALYNIPPGEPNKIKDTSIIWTILSFLKHPF